MKRYRSVLYKNSHGGWAAKNEPDYNGEFYQCSEVDAKIAELEDKLALYSFRPNGPETAYLKDGREVLIKVLEYERHFLVSWEKKGGLTGWITNNGNLFYDEDVTHIMEIPE